jgi:hypothetical protein
MRDRRELQFFAAVMLVIAAISATTVTSCGGGGDGGSNGELCDQCGDSDGPCLDTVETSGNDRPDFCGATDPCTVELRCLRKIDSAQRRCFPADPVTNALDTDYRCDGSRPNPSVAPTTTPSPTPTFTASGTPTPTGATPTGATPTPTATATPTTADEASVTISIDDESGDFTSSFSVTVTYPASKGSFRLDGATDCTTDEGLTAQDNGSGTLTLSFPGDSTDAFAVGADCTFHLVAGQTLEDTDVGGSVDPSALTLELEVF